MVDDIVGGSAAVIDIETIDAEDPAFAPVVEAFNQYGTWALPLVTLDGKVVSISTTQPEQITSVLKREIEQTTEGD